MSIVYQVPHALRFRHVNYGRYRGVKTIADGVSGTYPEKHPVYRSAQDSISVEHGHGGLKTHSGVSLLYKLYYI